MEKSVALLNRLIRLGIVNPSLYYSISTTKNKVQCQGHYNADEICRLKTKHIKWEHDLSPSGFVTMKWKLSNRKTIELIFTQKLKALESRVLRYSFFYTRNLSSLRAPYLEASHKWFHLSIGSLSFIPFISLYLQFSCSLRKSGSRTI